MKFKNILFFSLLCYIPIFTFAQESNQKQDDLSSKTFKQRLQFNLGGGIMFGNNYSNINIQPQLGYRVTNEFTAGIGGNFQYYKNTAFSTTPFIIYGGNVFGRYMITPNLFGQAEYQLLKFNDHWGEYALVGGGYMPGGGFYISAYYLLLYPSRNNIYGAPYVVRVGFMF